MIEQFIVASNDAAILVDNLLKSPVAKGPTPIHAFPGFTNIPKAYNYLAQRPGTITCYVHQDVFLPAEFMSNIEVAFERIPDDWGVLGVAGVKFQDGKKQIHGFIKDRGRGWGSPWNLPAEVDTLDEMLLITRGDLLFDEQFDLDFYGADICMQARERGQKCYAISAYCEHNSGRAFGGRTESFYQAQERFREKWRDHLPIATTCTIVEK